MPASDLVPYLALGGSLVVATIAVLNTDRQIRSQRREQAQAASRELAYECVDWLSEAGRDLGQWYGRRAQRRLKPVDRDEAERRARDTVAQGRRVSAKVGLLFGPTSEVTGLLDRAIRRYAEIAYLTKKSLPLAVDRDIDSVLAEWEQTVRELYDALAVEAGRPKAAGWVSAALQEREPTDHHDTLEDWL